MQFYIVDRQLSLLGVISTSGKTTYKLVSDDDKQSITDVSRTWNAVISYDDEHAAEADTILGTGNMIMFADEDGQPLLVEIMSSEHDKLNHEQTIETQDVGVDLLDETVGEYTATKAMTIQAYMDVYLDDSGWTVGVNEISNLTRTLSWESEEVTALARLLSIATQFDNAELKFRFAIEGGTVKKYVDIYKHRGMDKGTQLRLNHDVSNIIKTTDAKSLMTSIKATGGTPDGANAPITLAGYKWTDSDGRYVLSSGGWLEDTVANQKWTRVLSEPNRHYINRAKTYTATTQASLLSSALADLKKYAAPLVNYEVDVSIVPDELRIGDTVHIADDTEQEFLSARVLEYHRSHATQTATIVLGDYLIEYSQVSAQLSDLSTQLANLPKTTHPWIRYADDDQGTNMSALSDGKSYMAILWSTQAVPSDVPADYAGHWLRIGAEDGKDGQPGTPGTDGRTPYVHTAYAQSADGTKSFSTTDATNASYLGTCSDFTQADPTDPSAYTWAYFQGPQGKDGADAIVLNVSSVNGNMFKNTGISTNLVVTVTVGADVLTDAAQLHAKLGDAVYLQWSEKKAGELDFTPLALDDSRLQDEGFLFAVATTDVDNKSTFKCDLYE